MKVVSCLCECLTHHPPTIPHPLDTRKAASMLHFCQSQTGRKPVHNAAPVVKAGVSTEGATKLNISGFKTYKLIILGRAA